MLWHTWWQLICDICDKWNKYKSHTCEEGGAHLRISFWHLLMNFEKPEKNQNFEKNLQKIVGDIIILHMSTKNHNQVQSLRYKVTPFFCHLGPFFALYPRPLSSLTPQKTKILKKRKNYLEMSSFYNCATKNTIKWCMLTQIWSVADNFLSS